MPSLLSWQNWTWHTCQVKKTSETANVLLAGVPISGTPCPRLFSVPFYAEAPSDHVLQPEQSHLLPKACSPNGTDKRRQRQKRTERSSPNLSDILQKFFTSNDDNYMEKVSKSGLKGIYKIMKFLYGLVFPNFFARRSVMMILNLSWSLASLLSWQNGTWHIFQVKKTSKTAFFLLAGVTFSGTTCPRHFIVPFGAEAPSDHVVQAWAVPLLSWGLLSQWHRQETTTPEQTERPPPEPSDILKRFFALYDDKSRYYMKKVSKSGLNGL